MASVGEMAGGIAHEINTPLGAILLIADTARRDLIDEGESPQARAEVAKRLKTISEVSKKIGKIVAALRSISREAPESEPLVKVTLGHF